MPEVSRSLGSVEILAVPVSLNVVAFLVAVAIAVFLYRAIQKSAARVQEATGKRPVTWWRNLLALLVPQCVSRLHVLVALFTTVLSISLKVAGMTQWNIAVATVLGASLGTWLLLRKAQQEGAPCDFAGETRTPSCKCTEEAES